jgi:hypothetical protein
VRFNLPVNFGKNRPVNQTASLVYKIGISVFFLFFAGMGIGFVILMIREVVKGKAGASLLLFLIIPLIFALVGLGGLWGTWFGKAKDKTAGPKAKHARRTLGKKGIFAVGIVFIVIGSSATYMLLVRPLLKTWQARNWTETPCRIISATVGEHSSDDGTTYSIDITYEYQCDGRTLRSSRYDFIGGSSSGYHSKKAVVDRYLQMPDPICYVNPDNASEAVLMRKLTAKNAIGLFPLIFVVAGLAVSVSAVRRKGTPGRPAWLPSMKRVQSEDEDNQYAFLRNDFDASQESITLDPDATPLGKLVITIAVCLFWNGIVSVFVYHAIGSFKAGRPEWGLTIFLIPFAAIGLAILGGVVYQFLALFNPRFTLTLRPGVLYPGTAVQFDWQGTGKIHRIRQLDMTLTGREEATYRVGTKTRTAKNTFYTMELFTTRDADDIAAGQIGFAIPEETMHSFEADNNKIVWSIDIHGDIARWPDVKQDYTITISPLPVNPQERQ